MGMVLGSQTHVSTRGMVHDGAEAAREREGSRRDDLMGGAVCFRERAFFEPAATGILSVEPQWPRCEPAHLLLRLQLRSSGDR